MKLPEFANIEIPSAELADYEDALRWAMEEAEHHVEITGDNDLANDYRRDARVLSSLFEAVRSMRTAARMAQGEEPA